MKSFRLGSLVNTYPVTETYLPAFFVFFSTAVFTTFIPLYVMSLGGSKAFASLFTGIIEISLFFFDLPAGILMDSIGEKRALVLGSFLFAGLAATTGLFANLVVLGVILFLMGAVKSLWLVAVLSYLRKLASMRKRGRTIASLGGIMRLGRFLGPIAGGFIAQFMGFSYLFVLSSILFLVAAVMHILFTRKTDVFSREKVIAPDDNLNLLKVVKGNRKIFLAAGVVMLILGIVRKARQVILPIWGETIGLSVSNIGLIIGVASGIEMLMAIPGGFIMDKAGRKWALGLCLGIMSVGIMLVPLIGVPAGFFIVSLIIGIGNGFGSGINMTLGADFASGINAGMFLGIWRLLSDLGRVISPLILGFFTSIAYFSTGIFVTSLIGIGGLFYMLFSVEETMTQNGKGR